MTTQKRRPGEGDQGGEGNRGRFDRQAIAPGRQVGMLVTVRIRPDRSHTTMYARPVVDHPGRAVSDRLLAEHPADAEKQAAEAISEAMGWGDYGRRWGRQPGLVRHPRADPAYPAEIARRRAELGPLARAVDRDAAARWAATGSIGEEVA